MQHGELVRAPVGPEHAAHDAGVEVHAHADAAAEEVAREGGVSGERDDGGVVVVRAAALNPLFGEGAGGGRGGGGREEEEGPHVAEEEDVHVAVDAAVEMEDDEADGVGDLDGGEGGGVRGLEAEPLLAVCVLDDGAVGEDGFAVVVRGDAAGSEVRCRCRCGGEIVVGALAGEGDAVREGPALQQDVSAFDEGEEVLEDAVLAEHLFHGVGVEVRVQPEPESGTGEVLRVEVGFDEELDSPSRAAGPVNVVRNDGAGAGAEKGLRRGLLGGQAGVFLDQ